MGFFMGKYIFLIFRNTYLTDFWNWIDFLVTIFGYFTLKDETSGNFIRLLRLLYPLRSVNHCIIINK